MFQILLRMLKKSAVSMELCEVWRYHDQLKVLKFLVLARYVVMINTGCHTYIHGWICHWLTSDEFVVVLFLPHLHFTGLHGMQTRSCDENSVCPTVKCVHCDKTEEKSVQIFIPCE